MRRGQNERGTFVPLPLFFAICPNACGAPYSALDAAGQETFAALFRTGWFLESALTQMLVLHLLRTERFTWSSRASLPVCALTAGGVAVLTALPLVLGEAAGFALPPAAYFVMLAGIVILYIIAAWACKKLFVRRCGQLI